MASNQRKAVCHYFLNLKLPKMAVNVRAYKALSSFER
jgi:hypothetical protein